MYFNEVRHPIPRKSPAPPNRPVPEERAPEPQPRQSSRKDQRRWRSVLWSGIAITVVLAIIGGSLFFYIHHDSDPLPASITKNASFALYYPSPVPTGYAYKKGSAKINDGVVFFTLNSADYDITVSEQQAPFNPPQLSNLPGFTTIQTSAGSSVIGVTLQKPIAITLTNTTLITITGTEKTPSDVVATLAKTMNSLSN